MGSTSATLREWFATDPVSSPTVGGFLYVTVASIAVGMTLSAIRWLTIDAIHARTGIAAPHLDFGSLRDNVEAFNLMIEIHYRHYQFYANGLVAILIVYACHRAGAGTTDLGQIDVIAVGLGAIFFAASRDTLRRYHSRCQQLLRTPDLVLRP